jgi:hypothetical protein
VAIDAIGTVLKDTACTLGQALRVIACNCTAGGVRSSDHVRFGMHVICKVLSVVACNGTAPGALRARLVRSEVVAGSELV